MDYISSASYLLLSLVFVIQVATILIRKKALIICNTWYVVIAAMVLMPAIIITIQSHIRIPHPISILELLFWLPVLLLFFLTRKSYTVFGAEKEAFQKTILEVLTEDGYEYEQVISTLKISNPPIEITLNTPLPIGFGTIQFHGKADKRAYQQIIHAIRKKEIKSDWKMTVTIFLIGLFFGLGSWMFMP